MGTVPLDPQLLQLLMRHRKENAVDFFQPYERQKEFMAAGALYQERCLMAGNQLGKTICGAYETACHLTGRYPHWWQGRRWDRPNHGWAAGISTQAVREIQQAQLFGPPGQADALGTGFIPKSCIVEIKAMRNAGSDTIEVAQIKHEPTGGVSTIGFRSYEQGREKFQGRTLDWVWWDEEPPPDVYTEGNARWSATRGMAFMTFTPLLGMSEVVLRFVSPSDSQRGRVHLTKLRFSDAKHMTEEMKLDLLAKYPRHEWDARINGEPLLGEGAVFLTDPNFIRYPVTQPIPLHWAKLWGIDFGITHPFAAVLGAWDRTEDVIYILYTYRAANELPVQHTSALARIAGDVPVAWPHDGMKRDQGSGAVLANLYKQHGLKMLPKHATFPEGGFDTEAAVQEMIERFESGRLRVREDLEDFFEEYRQYHRKKGLLVKERDDILSATQKLIMMKRYARAMPVGAMDLVAKQALKLQARIRRQTDGDVATDQDAWLEEAFA